MFRRRPLTLIFVHCSKRIFRLIGLLLRSPLIVVHTSRRSSCLVHVRGNNRNGQIVRHSVGASHSKIKESIEELIGMASILGRAVGRPGDNLLDTIVCFKFLLLGLCRP
jgi:hypothetical protein